MKYIRFKPFDRILGRSNRSAPWRADLFRFYDDDSKAKFVGLAGSYTHCILYEGNENAEGTTNMVEEPEQVLPGDMVYSKKDSREYKVIKVKDSYVEATVPGSSIMCRLSFDNIRLSHSSYDDDENDDESVGK